MIYQEVLNVMIEIFGTSVSWITTASEIVAFIYVLFIVLLYTILPTLLLIIFASLFTTPTKKRRKRKWKN